jgi:hypothetical protein
VDIFTEKQKELKQLFINDFNAMLNDYVMEALQEKETYCPDCIADSQQLKIEQTENQIKITCDVCKENGDNPIKIYERKY